MTPEATPELRIGLVGKAHGLNGAVRVELLTDFPDRFAAGNAVEVNGKRLRIRRCEERDGGLLVSFDGVEDRNTAETLRGLYVTVPLAEARALPGDHYYHFQLVGLAVFDVVAQRTLGRVEEVLTYAANDVLRVSDGRVDTLIPMVKQVVKRIDPAARLITVELPAETPA